MGKRRRNIRGGYSYREEWRRGNRRRTINEEHEYRRGKSRREGLYVYDEENGDRVNEDKSGGRWMRTGE